jgi:tetratricopeptide (TPR) repeat protein
MITEQEFAHLLSRPESETLDFKESVYDLSSDDLRAKFIKDIICMANTPRDEPAYIVLGVKKYPNGEYELYGIEDVQDEADLQSQLAERVHPIPFFSLEIVEYQSRRFAALVIPARPIGPCLPQRDFPGGRNVLRQRQVYFRRGSKNDVPDQEDLKRIMQWIQGDGQRSLPKFQDATPMWDKFMSAVDSFEAMRTYVLVASPLANKVEDSLAPLGRIRWSAVFDFDPSSDSQGLLRAARTQIERQRNLYLLVHGDRPSQGSDRSVQWYFARGLEGRDSTLKTGPWKDWLKHYRTDLNRQFESLAADISPRPISCVVLWYDPALSVQFLRSTLDTALGTFGDLAEYVIVTRNGDECHAVASEFDAELLNIPLNQLCAGLEAVLPDIQRPDREGCVVPSSSGAPIPLEDADRMWIEEDLEIVHQSVGLVPHEDRTSGRDFLQGNEISWFELGLHCDVERDRVTDLKHRINTELLRKRAVRVNLYHAPGAGGTTLGRRVLWDFHRTYPCAILRRTTPSDTAERLYRLTSLTGQSILLLIDGAQIAERQVDELYDQLRSRQIPVVMLQTLRRFRGQTEGTRAFYLSEELTTPEAARFVEIFSREAQARRTQLQRLLTSPDWRARTPFYFGLETFGEDFHGIEPYVNARLEDSTKDQLKIMAYLALAYHYAQQPVQAQAFAAILGIPRNRTVKLSEALSEGALQLLVETKPGELRIAHDLLAREIIEQILWPSGTDRRNWHQNLSTWAKDFAEFCRGSDPVPSEQMLEIVRRTFIYRDNSDVLGTERSANRTFAQLLDDVPSREGRLDILQTLTELFPEEAHFWAHLGRYYAIEMKDFVHAVEVIEKALTLHEDDHVLHHMKGMALRYQAYHLIDQREPLSEVLRHTKASSEAFSVARRLAPDNDHGYISEVQLLARVLDYAGRSNPGGVLSYLSTPQADPFLRDALERSEDLLEQVRRNREGEGSNSFEENCRAQLNALYGRHNDALSIFDNLLQRADVYKPPIRRQIIWTYLARRDRTWERLESKEIDRIARLLEDNLSEEPNLDRNLRLWVQAVRRTPYPPSVEAMIERVSYWRTNSGSLDATYYLYVFHSLLALEGSAIARDDAARYLGECRQIAHFRSNRTKSFEWIGKGTGTNRLIHQSELGMWNRDRDFWDNTRNLVRVTGRISRIDAPQAGQIETKGGLPAFFVPAKAGGYSRDRLNRRVNFFLGSFLTG